MSSGNSTVIEFNLPVGFEKDGTTHRSGTMRRPKVRDILDVQKDLELNKARKALRGSMMKVKADLQASDVEVDPVIAEDLGALKLLEGTVMLPRLILTLGNLTENSNGQVVSRVDIGEMHPKDVQYLMELKDQLENPNELPSMEKPSGPLA